ncbi:acetyltransferase [Streptococcus dysgalactiae]|nr:acetyltransferase [Streptococcus dysgalactiae]
MASRVRKTGLGRDLVAKALEVAENQFPDFTCLCSGTGLLRTIYASFGFKPISEIYLEDDIPTLIC